MAEFELKSKRRPSKEAVRFMGTPQENTGQDGRARRIRQFFGPEDFAQPCRNSPSLVQKQAHATGAVPLAMAA